MSLHVIFCYEQQHPSNWDCLVLRYISDIELHRTINSATNKNEEFNGFTKRVFFGNEGAIVEIPMVKQHKIITHAFPK